MKLLRGRREEPGNEASDNLKQDFEDLREIVASEEAPPRGSTFECPDGRCFDWEENDWTKRLVHGLQKLIPNARVVYSAELGRRWATDIFMALKVSNIQNFPVRRSP